MEYTSKSNIFLEIAKWILPACLFLVPAMVLFEKNFIFSIGGVYIPDYILNVQNFYLSMSYIVAVLVIVYVPIITYFKVYKKIYQKKLFTIVLLIILNYIIVISVSFLILLAADGQGLLTYFDKLIETTEQYYQVHGYLLW